MLISMLLTAAAALGSASAPDTTPHGRYVEARTASVFAGACHYGAEATTKGREAILAWHFEGGRHEDVDLAGVDLVLVIAGDRNLADHPTERTSLAYVGQGASAAQSRAALDLVRARHPEFGVLSEARAIALELGFEGDAYALRAPGRFEIRGEALPDRACCKMPLSVWYRPFETLDQPLVGNNELFACSDRALGRSWSRSDENTAFTGTFRFAAPALATAAPAPARIAR
jgi:hypothetical protein